MTLAREKAMKENQTDILKSKLLLLESEILASGANSIKLNQQFVTKANMSFSGGDGRIYIQPASDGYDVSLSGRSLQSQMLKFMTDICGKSPDGHKQTKPDLHQPYWRVSDFGLVQEAVIHYSKTCK